MHRLIPLLPALFATAACVDSAGHSPSLLPRPVESQSLVEPERPATAATPDAQLDARVAEIRARVSEEEKAFATAAAEAEAKIAVARGLPRGSEAWLNAQVALGALDGIRTPLMFATADLDGLAIARGKDGLPPYPALQIATAEIQALLQAQDARVAALESALAGE